MENIIEATILKGPSEGEAVLIFRIPIIPTDLPFQFKRLQYPIRLKFAITVNKAQGQSLEKCGIDLNTDCFSHGQLYVACSNAQESVNRTIHLYAQTMEQRRMLHIYKFYAVEN